MLLLSFFSFIPVFLLLSPIYFQTFFPLSFLLVVLSILSRAFNNHVGTWKKRLSPHVCTRPQAIRGEPQPWKLDCIWQHFLPARLFLRTYIRTTSHQLRTSYTFHNKHYCYTFFLLAASCFSAFYFLLVWRSKSVRLHCRSIVFLCSLWPAPPPSKK